MNKCKLVKSGGLTRLVIKSLKGQQINEHELYAVNCNKVPGLLHLDYHKKKTSFKLSYDITGFTSFKKFLKTPMNRESFGIMLRSILGILKQMNAMHFNPQCVLYDFGCTMVNEATKDVYMVYVPVQPFESPNTLREFLLGIIERCSFVQEEDSGYVREYISILNTGIHFSVFDLEEYVNSLLGPDAERVNYVECPKCHEMVSGKTAYCKCGMNLHGNSGEISGTYDPARVDQHFKKEDIPEFEVPEEFVPEKIIPEESFVEEIIPETPSVEEEQGDYCPPTTVLDDPEPSVKLSAYLIRKKTGEKTVINKDTFIIGKSPSSCDYCVSDNPAVSRKHAKITKHEENFFICDLKSTNKTYINGEAISPEVNSKIFSKANIRLANEEFVFFIEQCG